jgi:hypothetical protein
MDNVVSINPKQNEPHQDYEYTVLVKFGDPITKVQQLSSFGIFDSVEQAEQFIREFPLIKDNYIAEIVPLNRVEVKPINH